MENCIIHSSETMKRRSTHGLKYGDRIGMKLVLCLVSCKSLPVSKGVKKIILKKVYSCYRHSNSVVNASLPTFALVK